MLSFSLKGQVALITGASHGIGKAAALGFAAAGADVVVASRKIPDLELVAEGIRALGKKSLAISAHVGKLEEIYNLVSKVVEEFGRIDILVNNAGILPAMASILESDEHLWDSIMNVNLKGLFFLSKATAEVMKEQGGGKIINIASAGAIRSLPNVSIYATSKAGVIRATEAMAAEWGQYNIRVNAVAPGTVRTRLSESMFTVAPELGNELIQRTPLGRVATPDDLVGTMIYLASDASSLVTGATIIIDGGNLLL